jgi:[protein-PII] uridylyltransferase
MNRYGILGSYLPEFGKIVGQTQHDLFHIYPVDVHTLQVVRNIRRLARPEIAEQFPVSAHIYKNLPKPELIMIAALYHDIAKGRGGDHSLLGSADIADFAERHGLQPQEIKLLQWLVENHLLMSTVSQREDTSDPDVIYKFAKHCGDLMHLEYLYVLTVADINATNPRLWTDWKGSLMRNLYFETKQVLQQGLGIPADKSAWVAEAKSAATRLLLEQNISAEQAHNVWSDVDEEFFLRERAEDIAAFTRAIIDNPESSQPVITLHDVGVEIPVATQIFVHTKGQQNIFAIIAAVLDKLQLNIQDARLHTTSDNRAFDVFYVLDENDRPIGNDSALCQEVAETLRKGIIDPDTVSFDISRRTPRQLKNFTLKTVASLRNDAETNSTVIEVITPDRPGLLAHLATIFLRYNLNLYNAKISTLGERVEDTFYLTDQQHSPLTDYKLSQEIQQSICTELDSRNQQDVLDAEMPAAKVWH